MKSDQCKFHGWSFAMNIYMLWKMCSVWNSYVTVVSFTNTPDEFSMNFIFKRFSWTKTSENLSNVILYLYLWMLHVTFEGCSVNRLYRPYTQWHITQLLLHTLHLQYLNSADRLMLSCYGYLSTGSTLQRDQCWRCVWKMVGSELWTTLRYHALILLLSGFQWGYSQLLPVADIMDMWTQERYQWPPRASHEVHIHGGRHNTEKVSNLG